MSAPNGNSDFVPPWMADLGLKAGTDGWLSMSKAQLRSQQRPDKPLKVQVWATGMLHGPGYNGQEATTIRNKKKVPLTPGDIIQELWKAAKEYYGGAGIKATEEEWLALKETKEHLRRALMELEEDGVALRTDGNGTPLRKLSADELRRLPSGRTRIFFWLIPRAADPENVADEWRDRQDRQDDPGVNPDESEEAGNPEVAKPWLPAPPIWQILKVFQIERPEKAQMSDPTYQKLVEDARVAARKVFLEVVNSWLPQKEGEVAAKRPPEVVTPRGALESKAERKKEECAPVPRPSSPAPPLYKNQSPPPPPLSSRTAPKAEEEDTKSLYLIFKAEYPADRFDEPKAKPSFEKKTKTEQRHVLTRLHVYKDSRRWQDQGGRWIPFASKWLETYEADPPAALTKAPKVARAGAGEAEESFVERQYREEMEKRKVPRG